MRQRRTEVAAVLGLVGRLPRQRKSEQATHHLHCDLVERFAGFEPRDGRFRERELVNENVTALDRVGDFQRNVCLAA